MSEAWHLAQINIGTMVGPKGDPRVQPFYDALDEINALAETSPGFVWRLTDETGQNATGVPFTIDPLALPNMSVWESVEALYDFVYKSAHTGIMQRRREFIQPPPKDRAYQVLWWIPAGSRPTLNDALAKLWHLDRFGPTPLAFTFKQRFPAPGQGAGEALNPDGICVGWE
jgi:hypothetical protein